MAFLKRRFQQHVKGLEYRGVDVFDDGTVQVFYETSPRDGYSTDYSLKEFLGPRSPGQKAVREEMGESFLEEVLAYLRNPPAES